MTNKKGGEVNKGGRPPKLAATKETYEQIAKLAALFCTQEDAASFFNCRRETFNQFLRKYQKARDAWEFGRGQGRISLRRKQFTLADTNATIAIWLGKQELGQKDITEQRIYLKRLDQMTDEELAYVLGEAEAEELDQLAKERAAKGPGGISKATH